MALNRHEEYRNIPFHTETRYADFYTYANVEDLVRKCEMHTGVIKCRTIGILQSQHGKFWLNDMDAASVRSEFKLRVSMAYLKSPPQSTVLSYPVQVFGTVQWKNRPVIFPKILQALSVPMAIRIKDIMNNMTAVHLATICRDPLQHEPT